ncbi:hypothetical protein [Thermosediminibacter oceani]|uniref:Lipoprotein n=1 Tax=Thermosediminibacter oceani (strain ATCC BAA-1034 / DSM 16646 / JW/IW-1228P) TaxID=555079 RepID=D9RZV1_THEOJ|nr:hypothetical protein [Thermosediminibacter oceani]ADL08728.1 hypothetical protein Toce_2007 [Thermosediminibacter oceani DSM 16646]
MKHPRTLRVFLLLLLLCLALAAGCSRGSARSSPESSGQDKKGMFALKNLEEDVEKLIKEFEKDYLAIQAPPGGTQGGSGGQSGQGEQKGGSQEGGQQRQGSQGGQQGCGQQEGSQQQGGSQQKPDWSKYEKMVFLIHSHWNEFREEALKKGAGMEMITAFNGKLNELTQMLTRQDLYGGLLAANDLYDRTVAFGRLFQGGPAMGAKRTLYYTRDAAYRALNNQGQEAAASMSKALQEWETGKSQLKDTMVASKVEFSLKELSEAIDAKDPNLIKMKYQIAEKNIKEAEKSVQQK